MTTPANPAEPPTPSPRPMPAPALAVSPAPQDTAPQQAAVRDTPPRQEGRKERRSATPSQTIRDHIYITRRRGPYSLQDAPVILIHVSHASRDLSAAVGVFTTLHDSPSALEILNEAARMSRARSLVDIHSTERDVLGAVNTLRDHPEAEKLRDTVARQGKRFRIARPENEPAVWRDVMKTLNAGTRLDAHPLVTYTVYTAAFSSPEHVYCGVVVVGRGMITVYTRCTEGDGLVDAELDMMHWVIDQHASGGRLDVYHSTDGARRVWEQADHLSSFGEDAGGADHLAHLGSRLRTLLRKAERAGTHICAGKTPDPTFDRFARAAAMASILGESIL